MKNLQTRTSHERRWAQKLGEWLQVGKHTAQTKGIYSLFLLCHWEMWLNLKDKQRPGTLLQVSGRLAWPSGPPTVLGEKYSPSRVEHASTLVMIFDDERFVLMCPDPDVLRVRGNTDVT